MTDTLTRLASRLTGMGRAIGAELGLTGDFRVFGEGVRTTPGNSPTAQTSPPPHTLRSKLIFAGVAAWFVVLVGAAGATIYRVVDEPLFRSLLAENTELTIRNGEIERRNSELEPLNERLAAANTVLLEDRDELLQRVARMETDHIACQSAVEPFQLAYHYHATRTTKEAR